MEEGDIMKTLTKGTKNGIQIIMYKNDNVNWCMEISELQQFLNSNEQKKEFARRMKTL